MIKSKSPWIICAAGTLLLFCTVGLSTSSFSVYQPYLISDIGLTNSQSSMFLTMRTLAGLGSTLLFKKYIKALGLRKGIILATLCTATAFLLLSFAKSFAGSCASAILLGLGYGFGGTVSISIIIHRVFTEHMGLALSICVAGTGLSTMICPPIFTWIIEKFSLRTSLITEAAFILLSLLWVGIILKKVPDNTDEQTASSNSILTRKANPRILAGLIAMFFAGTIANTGWSHLSVLYRTAGFSPEQVALLISMVGIFLTIGKLAYGASADKFGARTTFNVGNTLMIIGTALCCFADKGSMVIAIVSMILLGFSMPISTVGPALLGRTLSEHGNFDNTVRLLQITYMVGALCYSPIPGILADKYGSYVPAFKILIAFAFVSAILIAYVYRGKDSH